MCILDIYGNYFITSDLQFGFKRRVGCNHALYAVQSVVRHFTNNNSTVNLCALDMSKTFDRVNHYALFIKLTDRNVPVVLMNRPILIHWYGICTACVRWDSALSDVMCLQLVLDRVVYYRQFYLLFSSISLCLWMLFP